MENPRGTPDARHMQVAPREEKAEKCARRAVRAGTRGKSMQENEAALRYPLQMNAITRIESGEVTDKVGERVEERIRDTAALA